MPRTQLVWFKRDLRVRDHAPLAEAAARGPCLCVYAYEPEALAQAEFDAAHLEFANESLRELSENLERRGARLLLLHGRMPDVLERLWREVEFETIWAHEETGNAVARARDERVRSWARSRGIAVHELPRNGVVRGLRHRDGWAARWRAFVDRPLAEPPRRIPCAGEDLDPGRILLPADVGLAPSGKVRQAGGERAGRATLRSILQLRGDDDRTALSSSLTVWDACSRLSAHLALGNVSMRQVLQATQARCAAGPPAPWLAPFETRLVKRARLLQKFEDEPELEFHNLSRAFDGLREHAFDPGRFAAWCEGRTGFPLVDACMRALRATGWLDARMRGLLMSFASYDLWLHWRPTGVFLARHFLDFEPAVHWNQMQRLSGVTGIDPVRIDSPAELARVHDSDGAFIRRWVPELAGVPAERIADPSPADRRRAGYPAPIVDHREAVREARRRIAAVHRAAEARPEARPAYGRLGSRRQPRRRQASPS